MIKAMTVVAPLTIGRTAVTGKGIDTWGYLDRTGKISWCMDNVDEDATLIAVQSVHPFSLAF